MLVHHTGRVHLTGYRIFDEDDEDMVDPLGEIDSDLSEDLSELEESDEGKHYFISVYINARSYASSLCDDY